MQAAKDFLGWGKGLGGGLVALALCLAVVLPCGAEEPWQGTVLVDGLHLRAGPGRHHPSGITLAKGSRVQVLAQEGEWVRIRYQEQTGYLFNREDYLRLDPLPPAAGDPAGSLNRQLVLSGQQMATFSKAEAAVIEALNATDRALDEARKTVARLTAELEAEETRIRELEARYREVERRAEEAEPYVAERLTALYKLSWLGKYQVLASAESLFEFLMDRRSLEHILAHDEAMMTRLGQDQLEMQALMAELALRQREKRATAEDLSARIGSLKSEREKREALLVDIRGEKSLQLAAIEAMKTALRELEQTVNTLQREPAPAPATPPPSGEKSFETLKGLLMMPVKGKIISFFGHRVESRSNVSQYQSGISIQADRGEPVQAVHGGRVLFSSWFKGFGNMIILDHGNHYYTVYAHLEDQFKAKGDPVEAGEVIATVGDTGSFSGAGLYFEIRHHGKPMNPLGWIKTG